METARPDRFTGEVPHYFSQDELEGCHLPDESTLSATDYRTRVRHFHGQSGCSAGRDVESINFTVEAIIRSRAEQRTFPC